MSNVHPMISPGQSRDEAALWLTRLDRGLSGIEEKELIQWMKRDLNNESTLMEMAQLWDKMDALTNLAKVFPHPVEKHPSLKGRLALAASVVMAFVLAGFVISNNVSESPAVQVAASDQAIYGTRIGGQSTIKLADGSVIKMNTNTRLIVTMSQYRRLLTLEKGEIHVEVAHDPSRPLRVLAGDRIIQAVGTSFNVRIDHSDQVELIVTDGRVLIGIRSEENSDVTEDLSRSVAKGERIVLDEANEPAKTLEPEEIEVKLSWHDGNLIFRGESLDQAVAEVGRYTRVEFVLASNELKKVRVAGLFKAGDVDGFLASLRANFDIAYERIDENTISLRQVQEITQ